MVALDDRYARSSGRMDYTDLAGRFLHIADCGHAKLLTFVSGDIYHYDAI